MPMRARHAIHASADCTNIMPVMAGMTMLVETAAMLPWPICFLERLSDDSFFMYAMSGAAANIEKKDEKKPHHEVWKARLCGLAKLKSTS